jgi:hypothetical protein
MPQAGALICNSRDNTGGVENQNGVQLYAATALSVSRRTGRSGEDRKTKKVATD